MARKTVTKLPSADKPETEQKPTTIQFNSQDLAELKKYEDFFYNIQFLFFQAAAEELALNSHNVLGLMKPIGEQFRRFVRDVEARFPTGGVA